MTNERTNESLQEAPYLSIYFNFIVQGAAKWMVGLKVIEEVGRGKISDHLRQLFAGWKSRLSQY